MPGSWVACLDDIDDKQYHIGKVLSVIDDNIRVHYFGTKGPNLMHAVWLPLWRSYPSQEITVTKPINALDLDAQRLTGTWSLSTEFDNLIVMPNIGMTSGMRINAASRKSLMDTGKSHHRFGHTWTSIAIRVLKPTGENSKRRRIFKLSSSLRSSRVKRIRLRNR